MSEIQIVKVNNARLRHRFLTFPWHLYRHDPLWVPPLLPERLKTIDPNKGVFFERGEADFFIAKRDGKIVGTVCAAEDKPTNEWRKRQNCMFGFFEYIQDFKVFQALLETVINWARQHGLDKLEGPFHLDYEDSYGVLIRGRERPPALMCGHSPPYYQEFMQRYDFQPARDANLAFAIDLIETPETQRLHLIAERLRERDKIHIRSADMDHWDEELDRVFVLLQEALLWADNPIPWRRDVLAEMLEPFRQIADPELVLFAEQDNQTVGWLPGIPNLNEAFMHVNGLRYPWNYLQMLWYMRRPFKSLTVKSVLVLPEYQKRGAAVLLFDEMAKRARAKGYQWADLSITSEDNPDTVQLATRMGAVEYKRWQVYQMEV